MADQARPAEAARAEDSRRAQDPLAPARPARARDIVPPGPNILATFVGLACLAAAPTICLHTLESLWEDAIGEDRVASYFILAPWEETLFMAVAGALLFLVIGLILQAWQHRRPFESRWPAILAFPIAWALIVPETLLRGGPLVSGAVVASAVALAFAVQWGSLVLLRETMD